MAGLTLTIASPPPRANALYNLHLINSQTLASGNTYTSAWYQVEAYSVLRYTYTATLTGTTSPTFDFKVQAKLADGSTADDIAHDAQQSATATRTIVLVNSPASGGFTAGTSTAASVFFTNAQGLTSWHRLVITVGGTNVSFATDVWMDAQ